MEKNGNSRQLQDVKQKETPGAGNRRASFFKKFPRHDKLISINKRYTGKKNREFNLRHDWNSLLSDDNKLLFRHYSKLFFPHRTELLEYMADYQRKLGINVQFNTEVGNIRKEVNATSNKSMFLMTDQKGNILKCKVLIVASGLSKPVEPDFEGHEYTESYSDVSINPDDYEGKSVLILGRGNSAFELAESIYGSTNFVHMVGRSRVRLSWSTHYVGDLRAVNNALLDTYQLKSLDALGEATTDDMRIVRQGKRFKLELADIAEGTEDSQMFDNFAMRELYDKVILCLGFQFDNAIFNSTLSIRKSKGREDKFPLIGFDYQLRDVDDLYIAGGASHGPDFRKSAGGFIHGFRYTARALHHMLEWKYEGVPWPSTTMPTTDLLSAIIKRINEGSGLFQMFSMLGDVIAIRKDGREFEYLEEFPVNLLHKLTDHTGHHYEEVIVLVLQFGANFSGPGKDVFRLDRATEDPFNAHNSNFLHPVFYHYKQLPTGESSVEVVTADRSVFCCDCHCRQVSRLLRLSLPTGQSSVEVVTADRSVFYSGCHCRQVSLLLKLSLPTAEQMKARTKYEILPRPDHKHHIVEDFLTLWDGPVSHILPLRRFLETVTHRDLRNFYADDCFEMAMLHQTVPLYCQQHYLKGAGIHKTEPLFSQS
ncbi:FAD-dependent oxidoreductase domain-containing protein 2 [Lamellibrachia satsuma]|nr:FAD-dependent oxidoreductase domain-containing protein 2 [Lamellibrachia satsuma]